jgi:hypothetical protein
MWNIEGDDFQKKINNFSNKNNALFARLSTILIYIYLVNKNKLSMQKGVLKVKLLEVSS